MITKHNQAGISLMLAVLVLAAITAVAFSLATIVFIEIRSSGDVLRTEPSLYATLGVTEEALFQYKRGVNSGIFDVPSCFPNNQPEICRMPTTGVSLTFPGTQPIAYDDSPRVEIVEEGATTTIPLFEINEFDDPLYSKIEIEAIPRGNSGEIGVRFLKTDNYGTETYDPPLSDDAYPVSESSGVFSYRPTDPGFLYEMILTNPTNDPMALSISSYGADGNELGLPNLGKNVLEIVANNLGLTRTYKVQIPTAEATPIAASANDIVWFDDSTPSGAGLSADNDSWNWVSSPTPYSGTLAHKSNNAVGLHQHYFYEASPTMQVAAGEKMVTYVYVDAVDTPTQIMLQWNSWEEGWNHRAYWGANQIGWGTDGTQSRRYIGPIPATSRWVRLEVPASQLGLEGKSVHGMAFSLYGGSVTWDASGREP